MCGISTDRSVVPLQEQNESAAILKIKESMQEEAKRFEKDDHTDYNFMAPWFKKSRVELLTIVM